MDNEKKQVTYNSSITGETHVTFDIQQYMNNRAMFIGLMCNEDGYEEPFGDVTVRVYRIHAKERFLRISALSVQCR